MTLMKNKDLPKVVVIIPCYNREKFIADTIDSVLSQTYPNIETITVDDGSTDKTRMILDSYGDRIRILEHPGRVNKGQSAAINRGLRSSNSDYVAILDSDDLFAPEKIERQVRYLEKHPDIGLVYANGFEIDENGTRLYKIYQEGHVEKSDPNEVLMNCYFLVPNNSLVRRSAFDLAGDFDESLRSAQDHDMAIRLAEVIKLAYIDEPLFYYRKHKDSISHKKASLRWRNGLIILKKASERYNYSFNVKRKRLAVLYFRIGQCFLEEGHLSQAIIHFLKSGLFDPTRALKVLLGIERLTGPH